jgi:hypothetical protein
VSRLLDDVFCSGWAQTTESRLSSASSSQVVQAPTCERVVVSTRRSAGAHAEWHEACTTLLVYQLTESPRPVRRMLGQDRIGRQLRTADALPSPEFDDLPRWSGMGWEPLSTVPCRREEPCAARPSARLAARSLRISVGVGRKGISRRGCFLLTGDRGYLK